MFKRDGYRSLVLVILLHPAFRLCFGCGRAKLVLGSLICTCFLGYTDSLCKLCTCIRGIQHCLFRFHKWLLYSFLFFSFFHSSFFFLLNSV